MNPDGSEVTKLPDSDIRNLGPRWSPDGKKIVFYTDNPDFSFTKAEIWTMNADGTQRTRLTNNSFDDTFPTWSADGAKIAFERRTPQKIALYVMNADGTDQRELPGTDYGSMPDWSPAGKTIAFMTPGGYHEIPLIALVPTEGGEASTLPLRGLDVSWSPDGQVLATTFVDAFTYWPGSVYTAKKDGTWVAGITPPTSYPDGPFSDSTPVWSPDGEKIAFSSCEPCDFDTGGTRHISTANADGTNRTVLTTAYSISGRHIDWQPIPGPRRADYKNGPGFCRAERDFYGSAEFTKRYGGGPNAFGKCVSGTSR
jgi:Tol biopolymer transport system component